MKRVNLILFIILSMLLMLAAGYFLGYKSDIFKTRESETSEVMLEKVAKVFKMVAVEGQVSEIYDYKSYQFWDISLLRKKVLVRVTAKVSIGYDLENVNFITDESTKTIRIENFPEPELLSIDHDLDYYDMQESVFNEFSADDLTKINQRAKEYVVGLVQKGPLMDTANEQKDEIISLLSDLFLQTGWTLEVDDRPILHQG